LSRHKANHPPASIRNAYRGPSPCVWDAVSRFVSVNLEKERPKRPIVLKQCAEGLGHDFVVGLSGAVVAYVNPPLAGLPGKLRFVAGIAKRKGPSQVGPALPIGVEFNLLKLLPTIGSESKQPHAQKNQRGRLGNRSMVPNRVMR